jgi:nucleoside-diphosphate-sugar epimerase
MQNSITIFGCGWLGKDLGISLLQKGFTVAGSTTRIDNLPNLEQVGITPFLYDAQTKSIAEDLKAENVIISFPPGKNGDYTNYQNQILSLLDLLGHKPNRIILISTTSVYPRSSGIWAENSVFKAETEQAQHILNTENEILNSAIKNKIVLRFAGLIDKNRNPSTWLKNKKTSLPGDEPLNLIHKAECIQIIEKLLSTEIEREIFNACSDEHPTRKEFYMAIIRDENIEFGANSGVKRIIDNTKLKEALNYNYITHWS